MMSATERAVLMRRYFVTSLAALMWYMIYYIKKEGMIMDKEAPRKPLVFSGEQVSGREINGSSLMPMLIAGLVLIAVGYVAVMVFV